MLMFLAMLFTHSVVALAAWFGGCYLMSYYLKRHPEKLDEISW